MAGAQRIFATIVPYAFIGSHQGLPVLRKSRNAAVRPSIDSLPFAFHQLECTLSEMSDTVCPKAYFGLNSLLRHKSGPVLVHSDLIRASGGVRGTRDRLSMLRAHWELISRAAEGRTLWMPTFNYDFVRTSNFSTDHDISQAGALTEHFRTTLASWRSPVPIFSFAGIGPAPLVASGPTIDPFGADSAFARLVDEDGFIVQYGAKFEDSSTFLHHVERWSGGPLYRYDKIFEGIVSAQSRTELVVVNYHVRPKGHHLDYDWSRLEVDLTQHGILRRFESERFSVAVLEAVGLRQYWSERLAEDPLYLLDSTSRNWVSDRLEALGRRFQRQDFEQLRDS